MKNKCKVGDLVCDIDTSYETGIVIKEIYTVEIPPLLEILWDSGIFAKCYEDDIEVITL